VRKSRLLTFVVIGGGFTGVEVIGEVQDLIGKSRRYYRNIRSDEIRIVLIQPVAGRLRDSIISGPEYTISITPVMPSIHFLVW
jgi:NADH dehydrogenase FAD-containing subunit